ncbi:MAG: hypothetical protein H6745_02425 [Deltaproteobacteria bacterium]|nr:hypothetical protein [Deltaproteobacteria bacterium]
MREVTGDASWRDVRVGPLVARVGARGERLIAALHNAFLGYEEPGSGPCHVAVHIDATLDAPVVPGLPELPRLAPGGAETLRDESEGFALEARVDGATLVVRARLRDYGADDGGVLLRRQLEGLARVALATAAPLSGAVLLHGCAAVLDGAATVFVGASGDGKTTMARRLGDALVLADDTVLVTRAAGGAQTVAGTPFAGKEGLPRRGDAWPLARVVTLAPRQPLSLTPLAPGQVLEALLQRALWYAPGWQQGTLALLDALTALADAVPGARLASTLDDDVLPALVAGREAVAC